MKKNIKTIILVAFLWIPLSVVMFIHSTEESMLMRIVMSVAVGPILFFIACLTALIVSAVMLGSDYIFHKLENKEKEFKDKLTDIMGHLFNGVLGIIIVLLYYFTITGQHIFSRLYGGW